MTGPTPVTESLEPQTLVARVGNLTVRADGPDATTAVVEVDGKPVAARRLVITLEVGKVTTAEIEWYPGFEFRKDERGREYPIVPVPQPAAD